MSPIGRPASHRAANLTTHRAAPSAARPPTSQAIAGVFGKHESAGEPPRYYSAGYSGSGRHRTQRERQREIVSLRCFERVVKGALQAAEESGGKQ